MVIFTTVSYPPEHSHEMAKRFAELPPIPDFLTKRGPYFYSSKDDGIVGMALYELEKSKIAEGREYLGDYMATYFGVPDFKYEIKTLFEAGEALKMIGFDS